MQRRLRSAGPKLWVQQMTGYNIHHAHVDKSVGHWVKSIYWMHFNYVFIKSKYLIKGMDQLINIKLDKFRKKMDTTSLGFENSPDKQFVSKL